ncbi:MAG: hypothetical protein FJW38_02575 [Acidobacteria bacterium]|nr:hypothetical protein [Acidobacteriota bacterium]
MKRKLPVLLLTAAAFAARIDDLPALLDKFDEALQQRLLKPAPKTLGMSRIMVRPSFGHHFAPVRSDKRDFMPENEHEKQLIAALESRGVQLGVYLFGEDILKHDANALNFRALKGPGAITEGTPRPAWYPSLAKTRAADENALPDWGEIYPIAQQAMKTFQTGEPGFATEIGTWTIAARPALATDARCVHCHQAAGSKAQLGDAVGGIVYAYRVKP